MMETVDKYKLLAALVRAFFEGYTSGVIDCHVKEMREKFDPRTIKRVMVDHYERIADMFHQIIYYPLAAMNLTYDEAVEMVGKAEKNRWTVEELIKHACVTDEMYKAMIAEYKRNFSLLLCGQYSTIPDHLENYTRQKGTADTIDSDMAIGFTVRTVMTAYARGIRNGGTRKATLHQATVFRLIMNAMTTLMCDKPIAMNEREMRTGLEGLLLKACGSQHNLEVMMHEMDSTYADLVKDEGIIAQDDQAN